MPQSAFFITSGIASVVISTAEGATAEVALIGREGLAGSLFLLGPAAAPSECFMQVEGSGYRIGLAQLRSLFSSSAEIGTLILRFVQQQSMSLGQIAACNKLHDSEARLARWLLMVRDRIRETTFPLTQEFLAQMLGAQRPTVTIVLGTLQRAGLLENRRGIITILSEEALESAACECYAVTRDLMQGLYL